MIPRVPSRTAGFLLILGFLGSGCAGSDDGPPRMAIAGKVTLDGSPLPGGTIEFQPATGGPPQIGPGGSEIRDGSYRIDASEGLVAGRYKVLIFSGGPSTTRDTAPSEPGAQARPPRELIPARYNTATTLTAEVSKDKSNQFNFEINK